MSSLAKRVDRGEPLSAEDLRSILIASVSEHPKVIDVRPATTIVVDRVALVIVDFARFEHTLHVLRDTRKAA